MALYDDTGRQMRDTDRGGRLVDMLSTGTTRAIGIDPQIVRINLHIQIFFNIRHDITGNERGLTLASRVERGNTNQTMDGDIDLFISAYLKWISLKNQKTEEA